MSTLLEKQIEINRIVTTSVDQARAIEDPARAKVLEILYRKSYSAEQITNELKKSGYKKALTTIRHHLDILKEAGLIEIVKIQESRGAITKYYGTSTKLLGYNAPEDFDAKYSSVIKNTSKKLEDIFKTLAPKAAPKTKKQKLDPAYSQYVLLEIMNRAMTKVMENTFGQTKKTKKN
ncbi:transcriptional regulator [Nitrosopumilus sp. b1]|uniref:ArsR/SmtB family transcription factor n=1 Tax=Nitrosopumilus sp. b1 TaxID=2109907 RepID=UPI000E2B08F5|nr:winged helix-turn-helix domain-containing protein [Nitrosopumilus sp. b1]RDJ31088.1 MAG: ArsR family transcriptional regulator [Thermoproteota archaeon]KAF6242789.1 transcriptional regulator [Nitrosopumilus sp. b1]RDJ34096.1 MAG: ArsR family transcriptional regulator [Thermoproteota archaeon]RDJ36788.1 MAG: ArsR family transcriptional regulator [Thermoproteota archaeon]RDJ37678.1 MAG: ArsR family transcriptional regulator [Thermoproteota archaeon]